MRLTYVIWMFLLLVSVSCKKKIDPPNKPTERPVLDEAAENRLLKDSVYYYYKLYSFWETSIPKYDPISTFTSSFTYPFDVLQSLKSQTPEYLGYQSGTYDRFSYFTDLGYSGGNTANLKMDKNDGLGLVFSIGAIDTVAYPFISFVEGGSPAQLQGIERSDMVLTLNDVDMMVKVNCSDDGCTAQDPEKFNSIRNQLNNALTSSFVSLKIQKKNKDIKSYVLDSRSYEIDPLGVDTVFNFSNMNVGYFVYSSFEQVEKNNFNQTRIDAVFNKFKSKNIKALIVDLRYNGGGYVDAATYLADKIINSAGKDKLMLTYQLNDYLRKVNRDTKSKFYGNFDDVFFTKNNGLELETVCFIVSNNTASAAEMLINVLKPYMNVKLVSEARGTYGKPVGYFPQRILKRMDLWVTSFKLLNANGEGDYWNGLIADRSNVSDYVFLNFGEKNENMIAEAISLSGAIDNQPQQRLLQTSGRNVLMKMENVSEIKHKGAIKTIK